VGRAARVEAAALSSGAPGGVGDVLSIDILNTHVQGTIAVARKIKRLRGEGKIDTLLAEAAEKFLVKPFRESHIRPKIGWEIPVDDENIERGCIVVIEKSSGWELLLHTLMIGEDFFDHLQGAIHFLRERVISDRHIEDAPDERAFGDIVDVLVYEFPVWNRHQMAIQRADAGGAEAHALDRAIVTVDHQTIPHFKGPVRENDERAEDVLDRILGREGDGEAPDSQACDNNKYINGVFLSWKNAADVVGWGMLRNITPRSRKRRPRAMLRGRAAVYHVVSRCNGRQFFMEAATEKERFRDLLGRLVEFCGLRLLTYCLMSNHFHILVEVPKEVGEIDDVELIRRSALVYGGKEREGQPLSLDRIRLALKVGGEERDSMRRLLIGRMGSLPMFVKMLKQRYALGFNREHDRVGTLWEGCYRSVLVEPSQAALLAVGAYIDLNPVRAGMVKDPKDYRWSGYGEAVGRGKVEQYALLERLAAAGMLSGKRGERKRTIKRGMETEMKRETETEMKRETETNPARGGLCCTEDRERMREAAKDYRCYLLGEGKVAGGELTRIEELRCRVRYFTEGVVIGSKAYVDRWFAEHRGWFHGRRTNSRPMEMANPDGLCVLIKGGPDL
jgi:putative transposase